MDSGIIHHINNGAVYVTLKGEDEPREKPYNYPKNSTPVPGDTVAIDDVGGSKVIIAIY